MTASQRKITIALLGKTGHGKSATGNTILRKNYFKESSNMSSCSKLVKDGENKIDGYVVTVYDTPGPYDTDENEAFMKKKAVEHCDTLMYACTNSGVNAFILVLNYSASYTEEEIKTVNMYEQIFGPDFIKNHGILVFTHGENFDEEETGNFKTWCNAQTGPMKTLIEKFQDNILLIKNKGSFDGIRATSSHDILQLCIKKKEYLKCDYDRPSCIRNRKVLSGSGSYCKIM
ncbi:unnamed protein product [Lymnaea stagnalis]|uniref:AIG1-type G domain-containing protein n=1 Tax=Lymnaea stagnalis TaxID=6523 RepID=A0AAV2I1G0_LYMST